MRAFKVAIRILLDDQTPRLMFKVEEIGGPERTGSYTVTDDMRHAAHVFISEVRSGRGTLMTVSNGVTGPSYDTAVWDQREGARVLRWVPPDRRGGSPRWLSHHMGFIDDKLMQATTRDIVPELLPTLFFHNGIWRPLLGLR